MNSPQDDVDEDSNQGKSRRSTVAHYSDELRFAIIDEVFHRPVLWDQSANREPASLVHRKQLFEEIAETLSSGEAVLTARQIEKQWKNLKDTYVKVKKKAQVDENGLIVMPRWRFFNAMLFIDPDAYVTEDRLLSDPQLIRTMKRQLAAGKTAEAGPMRKELRLRPDAQELANMQPDLSSGLIAEEVTVSTDVKSARACGSAVRDEGYITRPLEKASDYATAPNGPCTKRKDKREDAYDPRSVTPAYYEDEYSAFCSSLVHPLREIGSGSRVEFLRLQKTIRDAIYETQMRMLSSDGSLGSSKADEIKVD
ncbi:Protein MADF-10 [Aphelenchoides avenae]|nr:Protein MADF-10 [Aphelenchus avenae]